MLMPTPPPTLALFRHQLSPGLVPRLCPKPLLSPTPSSVLTSPLPSSLLPEGYLLYYKCGKLRRTVFVPHTVDLKGAQLFTLPGGLCTTDLRPLSSNPFQGALIFAQPDGTLHRTHPTHKVRVTTFVCQAPRPSCCPRPSLTADPPPYQCRTSAQPAPPSPIPQRLASVPLAAAPPSHFPTPLLRPSLDPLDAVQTHSSYLRPHLSFLCPVGNGMPRTSAYVPLAATPPTPHLFPNHKGPTAWLFSIATSSPSRCPPCSPQPTSQPYALTCPYLPSALPPFALKATACRTSEGRCGLLSSMPS